MNSLKLTFLSIVAVFALSACDNSSKYLNPESGFVKLGNGWELHYPNTSDGNLRETTKNFGATYWYSDKKGNLLWYSCGLDSDSPNNFGYLLKGESSFFYRKKFEAPIDVSIGQKNEKIISTVGVLKVPAIYYRDTIIYPNNVARPIPFHTYLSQFSNLLVGSEASNSVIKSPYSTFTDSNYPVGVIYSISDTKVDDYISEYSELVDEKASYLFANRTREKNLKVTHADDHSSDTIGSKLFSGNLVIINEAEIINDKGMKEFNKIKGELYDKSINLINGYNKKKRKLMEEILSSAKENGCSISGLEKGQPLEKQSISFEYDISCDYSSNYTAGCSSSCTSLLSSLFSSEYSQINDEATKNLEDFIAAAASSEIQSYKEENVIFKVPAIPKIGKFTDGNVCHFKQK